MFLTFREVKGFVSDQADIRIGSKHQLYYLIDQ